MNLGRTVFSQLISHLPDREFRRCVDATVEITAYEGFLLGPVLMYGFRTAHVSRELARYRSMFAVFA